jgi:hypothetical protein
MLDPETFLVELYVLADTFDKTALSPERPQGRPPALARSEVVTLALFSQWACFASERAFYRWAERHLRPLFPTLPARPQFNRLLRRHGAAITAFALHLGQTLAASDCRFEILDGTGVATRNAKRRGAGWLFGLADIGKCARLGWFEGMRLLLSLSRHGAVTGWGSGSASTNDRTLAEAFFALRTAETPALPSVGQPVSDCYIADMGFSGAQRQAQWARDFAAVVICPPQTGSKRAWPKPLKRWLAGLRQVIETVNDRLLTTFRLEHERPHTLDGWQARLAAKIGLHNVCLWLNHTFGQPQLAIAELIDW